ncbi:hypothetical protein CY35_10G100100 [Sphagnum magellanicum]|nr:hypothetical protein CY35_10G100100 [Sphagnum magellanicum]
MASPLLSVCSFPVPRCLQTCLPAALSVELFSCNIAFLLASSSSASSPPAVVPPCPSSSSFNHREEEEEEQEEEEEEEQEEEEEEEQEEEICGWSMVLSVRRTIIMQLCEAHASAATLASCASRLEFF